MEKNLLYQRKINKPLLWLSGTCAILLVFLLDSTFFAAVSALLCLLWLVYLGKEEVCPNLPLTHPAYLTSGCVLSFMAGKRFEGCTSIQHLIRILAQPVGLDGSKIALFLTWGLAVGAIPFMVYVSCTVYRYLGSRYGKELQKIRFVVENCSFRKSFLILLVIYGTALFPLFRANFNYIDDNGRVLLGYAGWDNFSRYLSNYLSGFVHFGDYLTDISPLPQLLAAVLLVLASISTIRAFKGREHPISLWDLVCLLPLGLNPYFLENISYKMDAPYMALSVFASIFPLLFLGQKRSLYMAAAFFSMLAICMTYQAASGIFPMAVIFLAFQWWCKKERSNKEISSFMLDSALAYLAAFGLFSAFLMRPVTDYVSNQIGTPAQILFNYRRYLSLVKWDFRLNWLVLIFLLGAWYAVMAVYRSRQNKLLTFFLSVCVMGLSTLLSFGIYPALEAPLADPRAMYGVGAFIAFLGIGNFGPKEKQPPLRVLSLLLGWAFITFAATYGNALAAQQKYEDFRIQEVIQDLTDLPEFYGDDETKTVQISGTVEFAPVLEQTIKEYQMLTRLVPIQFRGRWHWGILQFRDYYGLQHKPMVCGALLETDEDYTLWPVVQESFYHVIYYKDNWFVIELK